MKKTTKDAVLKTTAKTTRRKTPRITKAMIDAAEQKAEQLKTAHLAAEKKALVLEVENQKYKSALTKIDNVIPDNPTFWDILKNGLSIIRMIVELIKSLKRDPETTLE